MFDFITRLFSGLFAPAHIPSQRPTQQGGYFQGDDSNWIITDNGPMQFSKPTDD
jgi:hypothetical protein